MNRVSVMIYIHYGLLNLTRHNLKCVNDSNDIGVDLIYWGASIDMKEKQNIGCAVYLYDLTPIRYLAVHMQRGDAS